MGCNLMTCCGARLNKIKERTETGTKELQVNNNKFTLNNSNEVNTNYTSNHSNAVKKKKCSFSLNKNYEKENEIEKASTIDKESTSSKPKIVGLKIYHENEEISYVPDINGKINKTINRKFRVKVRNYNETK